MTLARFTTLQLGGPAATLETATTEPELLALAEGLDPDEEWLVLGGGSNVLVSDEGFDGTVVRVATRGIVQLPAPAGSVRLRVQAGHPWDELVAHTVAEGFSGIEALSGIPGSTGAAPIQNIGAYGQEVGASIESLDFYDVEAGRVKRMPVAELGLGYRTSVFKRGLRGVVLSVTFVLGAADGLSAPVAYGQLATALGVAVGERMPLQQVRDTVLRLRASKGMVLDPADPDSVSAGSFFTNPIVTERAARALPSSAPRWQVEPDAPDLVIPLDPAALAQEGADAGTGVYSRGPAPAEYHVKLSAAWLIEQAGIRRGFSLPGSSAAISSKHTLAIVNRAGASGRASDVAELARFVQGRVLAEFGVQLHPEPVYVGF
ncbi:UDP-N-acetylmuramate dehydrogenase [Herbiconiux flava]|uniref:UDP-N-acetylenolpyruvoylglucosamine reductase n=1 Tax=Herbiconiux flava TaxID=881268 RepID=A0A852S739_9MICO|nr:UDP-N-acetylmuramate dehydrogenase [Herbiconiux flava]NYD69078.1 UDP-N-acetylmuramate dehydrogenase [Herbiconiux flava]GLK15826.1 UDP-N-acetylenolpyruvoylglucosamine reductase [Herbiconiux flava]